MRQVLVVVGIVTLLVLAGCASFGGVGSNGDSSTTRTDPGATETTSVDTPDGTLEVHFINVGQSVATLVIAPTAAALVDADEPFTLDHSQLPTPKGVGLSVASRSADTGVSDATSVGFTLMIPASK